MRVKVGRNLMIKRLHGSATTSSYTAGHSDLVIMMYTSERQLT